MQIETLLVGEGDLLRRCAEWLQQNDARIRAIVTSDENLRRWATKMGVPQFDLAEAVRRADELQFELLFSIGNHSVIPDGLVRRAQRMSINYHYGPLPEYSGLHVPSWAIFEGAPEYAITWHRIGEVVDGGSILKRVVVPIEPTDTALSLGLRCDEAAAQSFGELVEELASRREREVPQDLSKRRYFTRQSQLPAEGMIDWRQSADQIDALVRAADYGPLSSPLVWPKLIVDDQILAVRKVSVQPPVAHAKPGDVVRADTSAVQIATGKATVQLETLVSLDGAPVAFDALIAAGGLHIGKRLTAPTDEEARQLTEAGALASKTNAYWSKQLRDFTPYRLPYAHPTQMERREAASPISKQCQLPANMLGADISASELLVAAWCTFMSRASSVANVHCALAVPRAAVSASYQALLSPWAPMLARVDDARSVAENLKSVCGQLQEARRMGAFRRDLLGREPELRTRARHGELTVDVAFSFDKQRLDDAADTDRVALELHVCADGRTVDFVYEPTKLSRRNVMRLASQFVEWCSRLPTVLTAPLSTAQVVSAHERAVLVDELNSTRQDGMLDQCFHTHFERVAKLRAGQIALSCGNAEVSYGQLNAEANALAHRLVRSGVRRGDRVGVCLDRSSDLVVALLGVMKAGASYVPVDPAFPAARIRQMIDDSKPAMLITPSQLPATLQEWSERCLSLDAVRAAVGTTDTRNLDLPVGASDLAYVIYTSGSTGKPKGVEVTHGSLCNFLSSMQQRPGCTEEDRLLAVTTISFDIAALELFLPLLCGASVVIAQVHETSDGSALKALMLRHEVTMMQATPASWQLLLQSGWRGQASLSKILAGGEALSRALADQLLGCAATVWNMYGPTETTVWSTVWQVMPDEDIVIGTPIHNTQAYVLDEHQILVPMGFPGELYIGGAGVARGYHNDAALTGSRFLANPFGGGLLYRTGDVARFDAPGKLAILGRSDAQIKLRGYRIELSEVEAAIASHAEIAGAVAAVRNDQLVAYCVRDLPPEAEGAQRQVAESASVEEWRGAWDRSYQSQVEDPTFNTSGWVTSYDGQPMSSHEMREWQQSTVERILSYAPARVFEVGSGTGLVLYGVAPHCSSYRAIDASKQAVELVQRHAHALKHVSCEQRAAHDLPKVDAGSFDTVVINSVAQYFPSVEYLMSVLEWAAHAVAEGRIFIGDVRDLSLSSVFHADIEQFRSQGRVPDEELRQRIERARRNERELLLAPELFANLPTILPQIRAVEITVRNGTHNNEMTRYRYDVTLHVGGRPSQTKLPRVKALDWRKERLDLASLRKKLDAVPAGTQLRVSNVPNGRLRDVFERTSHLLDLKQEASVGPWVDSHDLVQVAISAGYRVALMPSRARGVWTLDAELWRSETKPDLTWLAPAAMERRALGVHANVPALGAATKVPVARLLQPWLKDRLPAYMVPGLFVELSEFPRTPNGKIDRKALPDPIQLTVEPNAVPANDLEQRIRSIWCDVLGHERIGLNASFFEIGGNSLNVARVQAQIEAQLQRHVPVAELYELFTIKMLAAHLAGKAKVSRASVPKRSVAATHVDDRIALVAMSCRLPGRVNSPEDLWELLERGGDGITDVPLERWDAQAIYDPDPDARGKSYSNRGGFVTPIDLFDAQFFGISPREARGLDPAQRMMLEVSWEAFERAGYTMDQLRGSRTGVYIGIGKGYHEYGLALAGGLDDLDGYIGTGSAGSTMSGRVAYVLGLEGPTLTVDTACSSSLVTAHLACSALRQGECDLALAAGVTLMLSPDLFVEFSRLRGMSTDGRCKSFSSTADGTSWSEGAAVLLFKRLSDAERDGDKVLAVVRGTAVNHAGHSASLTTPRGPAQEQVVAQALAMAGLEPNDIDYLEAHGTGTKLGDPIEATALANVFGGTRPIDKPLWVGSVKSNLGHTQAAAGAAGVIKTVLAMQREKLPRTLHVVEPSSAVDWVSAQMSLVLEEQPWRRNGRPRRAGVSSFGIGGTNAHLVLEEPPIRPAAEAKNASALRAPAALPFTLSGFTEAALRAQADRLHRHLGMNIEFRVLDVAYSLATKRTHFRKRLTLMAKDKAELLDALASFARTGETPAGAVRAPGDHGDERRVALLFSGQGSQLPGMGRELYETFPVFREALTEIVSHFDVLAKPLLDVMWAEPGSEAAALLNRTDYTQPALFALEVALYRLWESWGVKPTLLLGHSIGELAAAHVAGVFDLADACRLVAARGRLMQALPPGGAMASLEATESEVLLALEQLGLRAVVDVAGLNSPQQTVVAGDADGVDRIAELFTQRDRKAKRLTVSHAFHSHRMDGMLAEYHAMAQSIAYAAPSIPLVSSVTGVLADATQLTQPEYWTKQARAAVRFSDGVETLHKLGTNTFLELGPQPVLSGLGATCLPEAPVSWIASLRADKSAVAVMQRTLAELHALGMQLNWQGFFAAFNATEIPLPTYAFQRERYWFEPAPTRQVGAGLVDAHHPLLGGAVPVAGAETTLFTTLISDDEPFWVAQHRVLDAVLVPGTAFIETMRAAGHWIEPNAWDVADVMVMAPLALAPKTPVRMQVTVTPAADGTKAIAVYSAPEAAGPETPWQLHAEGVLVAAQPASADERAPKLPPAGAESIDVSNMYQELAELGYGYGPMFQGIKEAWHVGDVVWAKVTLPESSMQAASRYGLHPALLDSAMHSLLLTQRLAKHASNDVYVPFEIERLSLWRQGLAEAWVRVAEFQMGEGEFWASLVLYDMQGACVGRLQGLHAKRVDRASFRRLASAGIDRLKLDVTWQNVEPNAAAVTGTWGLLLGSEHVSCADEVRERLSATLPGVVLLGDLQEAKSYDGLICLWQGNRSVVSSAHELAARGLAQLHELAALEFDKPVVWVTRDGVGTDANDRVSDLGAAPLWGLIRTARNEHPELKLRIVDIGATPEDLALLVGAIGLDSEPECALRQGQVLAPRLERRAGARGLVLPTTGSWRLEIEHKGRLDKPLAIRPLTNDRLAAGEVRASVRATGVNFLDVLNALGMVETPVLGFEFAGVVTEVGASVKGFKPGDRVMGLAPGSFGSDVVVDARQIVCVPSNLTLEEAATTPMTFLTAWYGLHDLGKLKANEKVLIHAAAGGVGMAAVQLARVLGAEVYGTASPGKWTALRELGLDDDHIGTSRGLEFVETFQKTAPGRGFDVVLNSLAREFVDASLAQLRSGGRFLEMGKIDLREQAWVDENHPGVTYRVYNLPEAGPDRIQEMLRELAAMFAEGRLKPLPLRTFTIDHASEALRFVAQAKHIGKVVLVPAQKHELIRPDAAVLVTGGVGGLGKHVAKWLATRHGVKDLVLTSRRGLETEGAEALVAELAALGATATVVACDAADAAGLEDVVKSFNAERPLRGVVHAAGVLDDGVLSALTPARLDTVLSPKVDGAWNLHVLTRDLELDFFVLFSSISGVMGTPGQGNYAAANTFMDALAYHRRANGLPGSSVAWGAWSGGGMADTLSEADRARFSRQGMDALAPEEGLALLQAAVMDGAPLLVAASLDPQRLRRAAEEHGAQAPAILRSLLSRSTEDRARGGSSAGQNLRKTLSDTAPDSQEEVMLHVVRSEVAKALEFASPDDVDVTLPLQDLGLDSLTAVLLRNQLADITGLALPAKIATQHANLRALSEFLLSKLRESGSLVATAAAPFPEDAPAKPAVAPRGKPGYLEPELQFQNATDVKHAPQEIFLTGASGFVGAFLLHELLSAGTRVHCLMRAGDMQQALERLTAMLDAYGLWRAEYADAVVPVLGDLAQPLLGLSEDQFNALAEQVDTICHSGALVDWLLPLESYIGPNVLGTHEVLRLAARGRGKAVHYISTYATSPRYLGYDVPEDDREYGYLTSKWMAEQMVAAARRRGARAATYRLPFVGPSSSTGRFRHDRGDFLHNLVTGCIQMEAFPALDCPLTGVVPVDFAAKVIAGIALRDPSRLGKEYDFLDPAAPSFNSFVELVGAAGSRAAILPFDQWREAVLQYSKAHKDSSPAKMAAIVHGLTKKDLEHMLQGFPVGDNVLGGDDHPCPRVEQRSVKLYVDRIAAALGARAPQSSRKQASYADSPQSAE